MPSSFRDCVLRVQDGWSVTLCLWVNLRLHGQAVQGHLDPEPLPSVRNHSPNDAVSHPINLNFDNTAVRNSDRKFVLTHYLHYLYNSSFCRCVRHSYNIVCFWRKNYKFSVRHIVYFLSEVRATCFGLIN